MRLLLSSVLFLSVITMSCNRNHSSRNGDVMVDSLKFERVRSYARAHFMDSLPGYTTTKTYNGFDFSRLTPTDSPEPYWSKVTVYYNDKNEIVKVSRKSNLSDNSYEFRVIRNLDWNYTILYAEEFYNHESEYIHGFFIVYKTACYFISFDSPVCVMQLENDLKAIRTLVFKSDELAYKTNIRYKDSTHLYSEIFFPSTENFSLNKDTSLEAVMEYFNKDKFLYEKELVIGLVKEFDHLPLWRFGGHHEYDILATP